MNFLNDNFTIGVGNAPIDYKEFLNQQEEVEKERESKREEWLKQRLGKFTASEFYRLMTNEDSKEFPKGAKTYVIENVIEVLTESPKESYTSKSMERGNKYEVEAVNHFTKITGLKVEKFGENQEFVELTKDIGGTPDGRIIPKSGIETKCPNSKTHFHYLENIKTQYSLKEFEPKYYWQIQGLMFVTGALEWWFISYDPRFKHSKNKMLKVKIERDEKDILKLRNRLKEAIRRKNQLLKKRQYA